MGDASDDSSGVLSYADQIGLRPRPSPVAAAVLCLPGACCWCVMGSVLLSRFGPPWFSVHLRSALSVLDSELVPPIWCVAVITAIVSVFFYFAKPKPWYVIVNLAINIAGLLLTGVIVIAAIIILQNHN